MILRAEQQLTPNNPGHEQYVDQVNGGHDTLSDFVTFVCQETDASQTAQQLTLTRSPKSQYSQYNAMLPPPPLPPMARPVAIIRSTSDLAMRSSPPPSITPPHMTDELQAAHQAQLEVQQGSPPLSPRSQMERKAHSRIATPSYDQPREYSFNHFHSQPAQVFTKQLSHLTFLKCIVVVVLALQLRVHNVRCDQPNEFEFVFATGDDATHHAPPTSLEQSVHAGG